MEKVVGETAQIPFHQKLNIRGHAGVCALLMCLSAVVVCARARSVRAGVPTSTTAKLYEQSRPAMRTEFKIYLYAEQDERAEALFGAAFAEIEPTRRDLEQLQARRANSRESTSWGS